jgi:hypothetical protein
MHALAVNCHERPPTELGISLCNESGHPPTLYACIGSLNEFAKVDLETGFVTAIVPNLKGPHGLVFITSDNNNSQGNEQ